MPPLREVAAKPTVHSPLLAPPNSAYLSCALFLLFSSHLNLQPIIMPPLREALDEARNGSCSAERLKVYKKSHLVCKSSSSSSSPFAAMQQRQPVITYARAPKVIHTSPSNFMELVQKLTGLPRSDDRPLPRSDDDRSDDYWHNTISLHHVVDDGESMAFQNCFVPYNSSLLCPARYDNRHIWINYEDIPKDMYNGHREPSSVLNNCFKPCSTSSSAMPEIKVVPSSCFNSAYLRFKDSQLSPDSVLSAEFDPSIDTELPSVLEDTNSMTSDCNSTV